MNKFLKRLFLVFIITFVLGLRAGSAQTGFFFMNTINTFSNEYPFQNLSALFVDGEELYVSDYGGSRIYVFELDGTPIFQFGKEKGLGKPIDFFVFNDKIFVILEGKSAIEVFNIRGDRIGKINPPFEGFVPHRFALRDGGGFFVTGKFSKKICAFDNKGKYLYNFGGRNVLKSMGGIATKGEKVYLTVMDSAPLIRVFDIKGKYLGGFGRIGENLELFSMPSGIKVDDQGRIWVVDAFKHSVRAFDEKGKILNRFGGPGTLNYPIDIDFSKDVFFILEKEMNQISMFKREDLNNS